MQRKQQVGECWVCVILFACVCVCGCVRYDNCVCPPWLRAVFFLGGFFFGRFLLFLADL
jgi:hypothetical protein